MQQNHETASSESLKNAIALRPERIDWQFNYALMLYHQHRFEDASAAFAEPLKHHYDATAADYYLKSLLFLNKPEQAVAFLRERINQDPTHSKANDWICMGDALSFQHKPEEAVNAYKKALEFKLSDATKADVEQKIKAPPTQLPSVETSN